MTDFQVGDRVSVEGVVKEHNAPSVVRVQTTDGVILNAHVNSLTLVERPRRKLRVGSVWERKTSGIQEPVGGVLRALFDRYVWTGQTFVSPSGDHYARDTRDLDSNPELWREVPVEELEREAQ